MKYFLTIALDFWGAYLRRAAQERRCGMQKHGSSGIGGNTVMGGRFSCKFLEKPAAGGQGTAYVNNWQAVLASAESTIYENPARRHPERRWL